MRNLRDGYSLHLRCSSNTHTEAERAWMNLLNVQSTRKRRKEREKDLLGYDKNLRQGQMMGKRERARAGQEEEEEEEEDKYYHICLLLLFETFDGLTEEKQTIRIVNEVNDYHYFSLVFLYLIQHQLSSFDIQVCQSL
jgi:hypothetical protein